MVSQMTILSSFFEAVDYIDFRFIPKSRERKKNEFWLK